MFEQRKAIGSLEHYHNSDCLCDLDLCKHLVVHLSYLLATNLAESQRCVGIKSAVRQILRLQQLHVRRHGALRLHAHAAEQLDTTELAAPVKGRKSHQCQKTAESSSTSSDESSDDSSDSSKSEQPAQSKTETQNALAKNTDEYKAWLQALTLRDV